ncbi:hypothetical protein BDR22DRAFT_873136 [Usnea florida]
MYLVPLPQSQRMMKQHTLFPHFPAQPLPFIPFPSLQRATVPKPTIQKPYFKPEIINVPTLFPSMSQYVYRETLEI